MTKDELVDLAVRIGCDQVTDDLLYVTPAQLVQLSIRIISDIAHGGPSNLDLELDIRHQISDDLCMQKNVNPYYKDIGENRKFQLRDRSSRNLQNAVWLDHIAGKIKELEESK